jgi:spore coat protein U-like protein
MTLPDCSPRSRRDDANVSIRHLLQTKKGKIMKKTLLCALLAATFAAPAVAGDSAILAVSATVSGTCKFTTASFAMNFGTLDPAVAANQTQTTALTYKCTKGQAATSFSFDTDATSPASVNITNGTDNIPVSLAWTVSASVGTGFGVGSTPISMNVVGDILGVNYANVSAGAYTKNVAVVVAP